MLAHMTNLYVFGSGDCGQLGLGEDVDLKRKPTQHPFFIDKNIISIAAGGLHSLALSANGEVCQLASCQSIMGDLSAWFANS